MKETLVRVGTIYIPVSNVEIASEWYVEKLGARLNYKDADKAILDLANQSVFLVKAKEDQCSNFLDIHGQERFSVTFEVNGVEALKAIHREFTSKQIKVGPIEDRGHPGMNFVYYDLDGNMFDVWSELSPSFKDNA